MNRRKQKNVISHFILSNLRILASSAICLRGL